MHIPPPLIALALGIAMYFTGRVTPFAALPIPATQWLSGSLIAFGAIIAGSAVVAFRRHRTTVNPLQPEKASTLVTQGVFQISRNPMYLALLLFLIAWSVWLGNLLALLIALLFVPVLNRLQILPEERALRANFGDAFEQYCQRVRRWL